MDDIPKGLALLERILDGSEKPCNLPLPVLRRITKNFSEERKIGHGGCGVVYKGILPNGASIAVKKLLSSRTIDDKMFHQEVKSMMMVNHPNVVRFLGFCSYTEEKAIEMQGKIIIAEARERLLCFEYISNGSLENYLTDELRGLEWHTRYQIIKGVCAGLNHLHRDKHIIHMDLKPANILLDGQMVPKITDFGISRPEEHSRTMSADRLLSPGYCAPEYFDHGRMSLGSDIYSLGVIIIELVTGSTEDPTIDKVRRRWGYRWSKSVKCTPSGYWQITECLKLAQRCKHRDPKERPNIWDIIEDLNKMDSMDGHDIDASYSTLGQDMLGVEPLDLHFPFEPTKQKQTILSLNLTNDTVDYIAFCIQTMGPLRICVQPDKDVIAPQSHRTVTITLEGQVMGAQIKRHELYVRSTRVDVNIAAKGITKTMFNELTDKVVDEVGVTIALDAPPLQLDEPNSYQENGSDGTSIPRVFLPGSASVSLDSQSPVAGTPIWLPSKFLRDITNGFSDECIINKGAFEVSYKGRLADGKEVFVNKLLGRFQNEDRYFLSEVGSRMENKHENIKEIIGYCYEMEKRVVACNGTYVLADVAEKLICYKYTAMGSLDNHLFDEHNRLDWPTRFRIILGICKGVQFLHEECLIVHLNLKPGVIFLEDDMVPKISDFGLSRVMDGNKTVIKTETVVGSIGYISPEYIYRGDITFQADIYSLGILIFEIVTGEKNYTTKSNSTGRQFIENVDQKWNDSYIVLKNTPLDADSLQQIKLCIDIGLKCVELDLKRRPCIRDIIDRLLNWQKAIGEDDTKFKEGLEDEDEDKVFEGEIEADEDFKEEFEDQYFMEEHEGVRS